MKRRIIAAVLMIVFAASGAVFAGGTSEKAEAGNSRQYKILFNEPFTRPHTPRRGGE